MERWGLVFGGRRGEEGFGVFGEILGTVGRVEAFREDNQGSSSL